MSDKHSGPHKGKSPVSSVLQKQIGLICIIALIGVWQRAFVMQAANADIYIFLLLISAGFFGIYNAISGTYRLKNDFVALEAMKEIHQDALRKVSAPEDHARILEQRLPLDQIVYNQPSSLGTAHNLIVEEILRSGSLRISTSTMQVLVSDLENKLDERQGTSHYLGALMVLLGLLGTFIGLMHTLESVGGILGSLDLSGNGGTEAIAGLIESLKRPLEGMSTGFGASLFGLIGSLIIGVLSKLDTKAAQRLRHDFETWIRSTVHIEGSQAAGAAASGGPSGANFVGQVSTISDEHHWRTIFQVARQTVLATSKMSGEIRELAKTIGTLVEENRNQGERNSKLLEQVVWNLHQESAQQNTIASRLDTLGDTFRASRDELQGRIQGLNSAVEAHGIKQYVLFEQVGENLKKLSENLIWHQNAVNEAGRSAEETRARMDDLVYRQTKLEQSTGYEVDDVDDTSDLVDTLNHMIAATRLSSADVARLRHLSQIVERNQFDTSGEAEEIQNTLKGYAK